MIPDLFKKKKRYTSPDTYISKYMSTLIDLAMYGLQMGLIYWKIISIRRREKKGTFLKLCCFQDYNYYSEMYNGSTDSYFHALHLFGGLFNFMVSQKFARLTIYSN